MSCPINYKVNRKVLFIASLYTPHIGGVEKHISEVCAHLQPTHDFTIFTSKHDEILKTNEFVRGVHIHRVKIPNVKYIGLVFIWWDFCKHLPLLLTQDIIHIHDVFIWFLPFRILLFWKPVYMTFHGWEGIYPIPLKSLIQKKLAQKLVNSYIYVGRYLQKIYGLRSKYITYGGVKCLNTSLNQKRNKLVYLGRLSPDTDLLILLEALKLNKRYKVIFCGDGPLRDECKKYGSVIGYTKKSYIYLSSAKICVAGGYLSALEALSLKCHTIVIAKNPVRNAAFKMSPFYRRVKIVSNVRSLNKCLFLLNYSQHTSNMNKSSAWALSQNWEKVSEIYVQLWKVSS